MGLGKTLRTAFVGLGIVVVGGTLSARAPGAPATSPAVGAKPVAGTTTRPAVATATKPAPETPVDRVKDAVAKLTLTAEQKPKIDAAFATAEPNIKAAEAVTDPAEKKTKVGAVMNKLTADLTAVLNPDQRRGLMENMESAKLHARLNGLSQKLHRPEMKLTAEQGTKVDTILADTLKKIDAVLAEAFKNKTDYKKDVDAISKKFASDVTAVLTTEQLAVLKALK